MFKSGNTYQYKYFGKAETGLGFGDSKTVGLAVECQLRLSVPQPCEYRMKVTECKAFEHDAEAEDDDDDQDGHQTLQDEVRHLESKQQVSRRGYKESDRSAVSSLEDFSLCVVFHNDKQIGLKHIT